MKLFELFATLTLDTKDFNSNVDSAIDKGNELGDTMGTKMTAKAVAWGNAMYDAAKKAVTSLVDFGQSLVTTTADVQAEQAQFESTFGSMGDVAKGVFDEIGANTNIFATRLQNTGVKAFSQFRGAGLEATDAMGAMSKYLSLAADAAAYYDISLEDADTRLRSFLRGNVEAGDAIGLFTSAAQRDTYALEMYGGKWQDLTEAQRQMLMLKVAEDIYKQSGAVGQAAKEGHNFSNVLSNVKERWRQAMAVIGKPVLEAVIPAFERLGKWIEENPETMEKLGEVIGTLAEKASDAFIGAVTWLSENKETVLAIFDGVLATIQRIVDIFAGQYTLDVTARVTTQVVDSTGSQTAGALTQSFMGLDPLASAAQSFGSLLSYIFNGRSVGSNAVGLDYVPYDDYLTRLHEGEAVLTKSEATAWRRGEGQGVDMRGLADEIKSAVREGLAGMSVNMDGQSVGNVVTKQVSRNIARQTHAGRFAT